MNTMSFLSDAVTKVRSELDSLIASGTSDADKVEAAFKRGVVHSALVSLETDASDIAAKLKAAFDLGASTKD